MGEKLIVVSGVKVGYEGYFDSQALYKLIDRFTAERGYDKNDKLHEVKVKEDGKYINLDLEPSKSISEHVKFTIKTEVAIEKLTKETITIDAKKLHVNKGKIKIEFSGILNSDYEDSWESEPWRVFIRTIMDKFVLGHYDKDFQGMLKKDVMLLRNEVSSFLNLHKYTSSEQHH